MGDADGAADGAVLGIVEGIRVGKVLGIVEGRLDGSRLGSCVGSELGNNDGSADVDGARLGSPEGNSDCVRSKLGNVDGFSDVDGARLGEAVGHCDREEGTGLGLEETARLGRVEGPDEMIVLGKAEGLLSDMVGAAEGKADVMAARSKLIDTFGFS